MTAWVAWLIRSYREDAVFKSRVILYRGMLLHCLYALLKLVTGLATQSPWFISIAIYYGVLTVLKTGLIRQDLLRLRDGLSDERPLWESYRRTGCLMLLLNLALSGITFQVVRDSKSYSYPGILIFAIAAYTFYRITMTIVRLLRARKGTDPLFAAAAFIDCSFAVTSMFTLQTAMFASFSPELDVRLPNILTGTGVVILITGLSGYMILHGGRNLRRLEETGWKN